MKVNSDGGFHGNLDSRLGHVTCRRLSDRLKLEPGDIFALSAGLHLSAVSRISVVFVFTFSFLICFHCLFTTAFKNQEITDFVCHSDYGSWSLVITKLLLLPLEFSYYHILFFPLLYRISNRLLQRITIMIIIMTIMVLDYEFN